MEINLAECKLCHVSHYRGSELWISISGYRNWIIQYWLFSRVDVNELDLCSRVDLLRFARKCRDATAVSPRTFPQKGAEVRLSAQKPAWRRVGSLKAWHPGHQRSSLLHVATDRHGPTDEGSDEPGTPAPALSELRAVISWLQKGLPFILILLAKLCFQHKLGLAVCIGMVSTFAYANSALKHQVSLKEKRSILVVFWISVFLSGNTFYLLYTFSSQRLYNSLMFLRPTLEGLDFFDLIWMVGIADFVVKYATVILKCLILALPRIVLEVKSKGKFYLIVEELSQLFRTLVPIQLWYKYILGDNPSSGYFLGGVLIILYSLCKSFDVCGRIGGVRKALQALGSPQKYGVRATSQQCSEAGDICAICQADFKEPCALMCQHVFCEECLCLWFDKEKTCPLCRAVVVDSVRLWKDGTTSAHFQVY
ncbi:hypothetical protein NDU88_005383 [Pleurodeles waltl]|uniref:RING-type domain-containing protein n=1 Tax=Pleurodeles waltl TaxID=8319 RepID=A0AAV7LMI2_PLEWA|nr:hypothetical protein NDU88_005383 [Pleurodeles waltl]